MKAINTREATCAGVPRCPRTSAGTLLHSATLSSPSVVPCPFPFQALMHQHANIWACAPRPHGLAPLPALLCPRGCVDSVLLPRHALLSSPLPPLHHTRFLWVHANTSVWMACWCCHYWWPCFQSRRVRWQALRVELTPLLSSLRHKAIDRDALPLQTRMPSRPYSPTTVH